MPGQPVRVRLRAVWATVLLGVFPAILALTSCSRLPKGMPVVANTAQLRRLKVDQIRSGVPVRLKGIVTYADRPANSCFVQDSTGGVRVVLATGQVPPKAGSEVVVSGLAGSGGAEPSIIQAKLRTLGEAALPAPVAIRSGELHAGEYEYRQVVLAGVVQAVETEHPGLMSIDVSAYGIPVRLRIFASSTVINDDWIDSEIRASGVLSRLSDSGSAVGGVTLWVADVNAVEKLDPPQAPAALPVTPIRKLLEFNPANKPEHRVRVHGTPGWKGWTVADRTGQIGVRMANPEIQAKSSEVDVAGFLVWENGRQVLSRAVPVETAGNLGTGQTAPQPLLTTALAVHSLPANAAELGYPVRLKAVVTYSDPASHLLFVQDRTDGVFVIVHEQPRVPLQAGDRVDVTGVTIAGGYAPDVDKARVEVIGRAPMPETQSANLMDVLLGHADCRWIQLEGIVRHVEQEGEAALLAIAWGRETYKAHVLGSAASLANLVDAEVSLQGVCGTLFNRKRQRLGIQMFVPGTDYVRVLRPAARDPFSLRVRSVEDLLRFSRARDMEHRVRLQGTVTYVDPSGSLWIRDATGGLMIQGEQQGIAPGDVLDVVGFPDIGAFAPVLRSASARKLQTGPAPNPESITAQDAMNGDYDAQLVQLDGKLIDRLVRPPAEALTLESGGTIFSAILPNGAGAPNLKPGAILRLTGICTVDLDQSQDLILPHTFRLLLRSPADIIVMKTAPWLTADRITPVLTGTAVLIVAALAWAGLLRRRVSTQTGDLVFKTLQLQEANRATREALQKAREAESLELDRKRILELVARRAHRTHR